MWRPCVLASVLAGLLCCIGAADATAAIRVTEADVLQLDPPAGPDGKRVEVRGSAAIDGKLAVRGVPDVAAALAECTRGLAELSDRAVLCHYLVVVRTKLRAKGVGGILRRRDKAEASGKPRVRMY